MNLPIYFFTFGGMKHGPLSKEDIGSLYDAGMIGLDLPVKGGAENLTVRHLVAPRQELGQDKGGEESLNNPEMPASASNGRESARQFSAAAH